MSPVSPDDLERWIAAFRGPLTGLLASWGNDWAAAEELAADAFAEGWVHRERFEGDPRDLSAAGAWLRGIAFHLSESRRRKRAVRRAEPIDAQRGADLAAPVEEEDERRALLVAAFAEIGAPFQTVLRMHYLEETSARDVAALLGVSAKTIESRLYQARRALRERVDRLARASGRASDVTPTRVEPNTATGARS